MKASIAAVAFGATLLMVTAGSIAPTEASSLPDACTPAPAAAVADRLDLAGLRAEGILGEGVTIGVVSTSYNNPSAPVATNAEEDVASGALPGAANPCGWTQEVRVLHDEFPGNDEGRAMLQVVHAVAPAADLVFATAGVPAGSTVDVDTALVDAIDALVAAGVDIIVDDVLIYSDPVYAAGPSAAAAERAAAAGVAYVVLAGNYTLIGSDLSGAVTDASIASWSTQEWKPIPCPTVVTDADPLAIECLDFGSGDPTQRLRYDIPGDADPDGIPMLSTIQWADPPNGVTHDITGYVLDSSGAIVNPYITDMLIDGRPGYDGMPLAFTDLLADANPGDSGDVEIVIVNHGPALDAPMPVKLSLVGDGGSYFVAAEHIVPSSEVTVGEMLFGRAANLSSFTVAAQPMSNPEIVGCTSWVVECFSATGPSIRYFGAVNPDGSPSPPLVEPVIKTGPDIVGVDGIPNTFLGQFIDGQWLFFGTSAATPTVGASLALAMQVAPEATLEQLRAAMVSTATPLTAPWTNTVSNASVVGAGRIDVPAFIDAVRPVTPTPTPSPTSAAAGGSGRLADSGSEVGAWPLLFAAGGVLLFAIGVRVARRQWS